MQIQTCCFFVPQVIDKSAKEADIILQYVKNTHAATHNTYTLEVQEVSNMAALFLCFSVNLQPPSHHTSWFFLPLDLQNMQRGGAPALPSFRGAAQPPAAVARLSHHQLCGYYVSGSPHRPAGGSSGQFPEPRRQSVFSAPFSPFSLFIFVVFLQTGYMFGKGVYFADMVSKSANYCHTSQSEPVGLLLLAEVALGNMWVTSL